MNKRNLSIVVIPAKAGIQEGQASAQTLLDPGFRRGDEAILGSAL